MSYLIKRIDDYMQGAGDELGTVILADCRAEIERLLTANEALKGLCEDYQVEIRQRQFLEMRRNVAHERLGHLPSEPTNAMIKAFIGENYDSLDDFEISEFHKSYEAMLKASKPVSK